MVKVSVAEPSGYTMMRKYIFTFKYYENRNLEHALGLQKVRAGPDHKINKEARTQTQFKASNTNFLNFKYKHELKIF